MSKFNHRRASRRKSEAQAAEDQGAPMVLGSVRGYRLWLLRNKKLYSLYRPTFLEHPPLADGHYVAECPRIPASMRDHHPVPTVTCTCGFYAYYKINISYLLAGEDTYEDDQVVLGAVQLSGRVIFGETGAMRASRMQLEALAMPNRWVWPWSTWPKNLEDDYQVPVVTRLTGFLSQYPLGEPLPVVGGTHGGAARSR